MSIELIVVAAFLLGPLACAAGAFKLAFPKHTVKFNDTFFVLLATPLVLTVDGFHLHYVFNKFQRLYHPAPPIVSYTLPDLLLRIPSENFLQVMGFMISMWLGPFVVVLFLCSVLKRLWQRQRRKSAREGIGTRGIWTRLVEDHVLNYMGRLTLYDPNNERLLVDVRQKDGNLYSGIYEDYFLESGKLAGVSCYNVIRYHCDATGKISAHLIPNRGTMFFPVHVVEDLHFWKLKEGAEYTFTLRDAYNATRFVWHLSLYLMFPKFKISSEVSMDKVPQDAGEAIVYGVHKLGLQEDVKNVSVAWPSGSEPNSL